MSYFKVSNYRVFIEEDLSAFSSFLKKRKFSTVVILVDENTRAYCLPDFLKHNPILKDAVILEIPAGESYKSLDTCRHLWQTLLSENIDRQCLWLNLGGGMVSDIGGFTAAAYKRGISFMNIPTSLLAQVDATIGGKLGVNLDAVKNSIGFFQNPAAVFIYPGFLKTLPQDEFLSGYAEMLKHALIGSEKHWQELSKINPIKHHKWLSLIQKSLLVKKKIVEADPFEKGMRKILNFGHTFGHAFESAGLQSGIPVLHGHAVAMGMIAEAYLSYAVAGLTKKELTDITRNILKWYRPFISEKVVKSNWQMWITHDKKNASGSYNFTLLKSIGQPVINIHCDKKLLHESVDFLKSSL